MNTQISLIAAPWSNLLKPSIQIGALHAELKKHVFENVKVDLHSAFLEIPAAIWKEDVLENWMRVQAFEEYPYSLAYLSTYGVSNKVPTKSVFTKLLTSINESMGNGSSARSKTNLKSKDIQQLAKQTLKYADFRIQKTNTGLNVFGFTLNYHQVMSSVFIAKRLFELCPNSIFLFGGMGASLPEVVRILQEAQLPAYGVFGEGEKRLLEIARICSRESTIDQIKIEIAKVDGVFSVQSPPNLYVREKSIFENQLMKLEDLAAPSYDEYFDTFKSLKLAKDFKSSIAGEVRVPLEGTRGCFAKCTFCAANTQWNGFRKLSNNQVLHKVRDMLDRHRVGGVQFVDNVCDTWAEGYADALIQMGVKVPAFMELRAHHPEVFWTKLALAGVEEIQIGVEALTDHLLKVIKKGTTAAQNLMVSKYLFELGILSSSNLITHYPGSTIDDIDQTQDILEKTIHFPRYSLATFSLHLGSPLYEARTQEEKKRLQLSLRVDFPKEFEAFGLEFGYKTPKEMSDAKVMKRWDKFTEWYARDYRMRQENHGCELRSFNLLDGGVEIRDSRKASVKTYKLEKRLAEVLKSCHSGRSIEVIQNEFGLNERAAKEAMAKLEALELVHCTSGRYVSLVVRSRDELIQNYFSTIQSQILFNRAVPSVGSILPAQV